MKAWRLALVFAVLGLAAVGGMAAGGAAGYARTFVLPADGELAVVNSQANVVWRPCVVSVICPSVAARTVTVYRVAGEMEYAITESAGTARVYVYEFEAVYWCGLSNGVKVCVRPACTGMVEVVYE